MTQNDSIEAGQSAPEPGKRQSRAQAARHGGAALLTLFALCAYGPGDARGQPSGLQIVALAQGSSPDTNVTLPVGGPSDVLQAELIFQPGGSVGWHLHPGPVVVVVKSGVLLETHSNGCTTVRSAGSVFFEEAGVVHNAVNNINGVTDVYVTFLSPSGASPLIPQPDPGAVCPGGVSMISAAIAVNVNTSINAASPPPATFNIDSEGAIRVAVLGSDSYDVTTIDPSSAKFGPKGAPNVSSPFFQDVNNDGKPDLILSFVPAASGVGCSDSSVVLTGQTFGKQPFSGSETIQTTHTSPCPR
jgi:quercetin dioxygenase-like cupin family protein